LLVAFLRHIVNDVEVGSIRVTSSRHLAESERRDNGRNARGIESSVILYEHDDKEQRMVSGMW